MAGIEYTQVFSYTAAGSGSTGYQYFQLGNTLQTAGSAFVIKYLSVYSTTGIANTSPAYAIQMVSASSNAGATSINVLTNNNAVASGVPSIILNNIVQEAFMNKGNQVIINQNYIGINANMVAAGTLTIVVSYSLIPAANPVIANFGILTAQSEGNLAILDSGSKTRILKSALVSNFDTTETYTTQFAIYSGGIFGSYLTQEFTLAPGDSVCYSLPFYLTASSTLNMQGVYTVTPGGVGLSSYCSYIQETL